jgi:succinate dehydrogenase / fumarate reductase, membrane anchor subunit
LALVPLNLWLVVGLLGMVSADYEQAVGWVRAPGVTILLVLFVVAFFHHGQLGMQVVCEDYVHHEAVKVALIVALKFSAVAAAAVCVAAIFRITFGSP